jgi:hypothetical protein
MSYDMLQSQCFRSVSSNIHLILGFLTYFIFFMVRKKNWANVGCVKKLIYTKWFEV